MRPKKLSQPTTPKQRQRQQLQWREEWEKGAASMGWRREHKLSEAAQRHPTTTSRRERRSQGAAKPPATAGCS